MSFYRWANNVITTLNGAINASQTTLVVTTATAFPAAVPFTIAIDQEIMLVTITSGTTFTVTRAAEPVNGVSAGASHASGATVSQVLTNAGLQRHLLVFYSDGTTALQGSFSTNSNTLVAPNGGVLSDTGNWLYYPDTNVLVDNSSALQYVSGGNMADSSGTLFYADGGSPLADATGNLYYSGSSSILADSGGNLYYSSSDRLADSANLYVPNLLFDGSSSGGSSGQILTATGTKIAWTFGTPANVGIVRGGFTATGTATTSFVVTIGVTQANTNYRVFVTPTDALTAVLFYISAKSTTTFTVTFLSGLTGSVQFDWGVIP